MLPLASFLLSGCASKSPATVSLLHTLAKAACFTTQAPTVSAAATGFAALDQVASDMINADRSSSNTAPDDAQASTSAPSATPASWPFLDTGRPNHLPRIGKKQKPEAVPLLTALEYVQKSASRRFVETVEMHVRLKVDPRQGDQMVRGAVVLPFGTGKQVRVCVFASGAQAEAAAAAGADVVGDLALIDKIAETKGGCIDFEKCVATPEFMKALAKVGKILGPRGMMPNPKVGTMTSDVVAAVTDMRRGRVEYRVDKTSIVHLVLGKANFPTEQLFANIGAATQSLLDTKPKVIRTPGLAGYARQVHLCTSMGPSIPVVVSSLLPAIAAAANL